MSVVSSSIGSVLTSGNTTTVGAKTTPTVANITTSATPNTETSFAFPADIRAFRLIYEGNRELKVAFSAGTSGTTWFPVYPYNEWYEGELNIVGLIIYIQSPQASAPIKILSWS